MADLNNSQRRVSKATYVPLTLPPTAQNQCGRVVEKSAFLRSLKLDASEFVPLAATAELRSLKVPSVRGKAPDTALVELVRAFVTTPHPTALKQYGPTLAQVSMDDLQKLGNAVVSV